MSKTALLLADGFEEVEALTVVDLLRRAGVGCDMVSIANKPEVIGSHGIVVKADKLWAETDFSAYLGVILPGGLKGTQNLAADENVIGLLRDFAGEGKLTAAICAAPTVLAKAGLLKGKKAVCYPGLEGELTGAEYTVESVVQDGAVITSRGVGTAIDFALALITFFTDADTADNIAKDIVYR